MIKTINPLLGVLLLTGCSLLPPPGPEPTAVPPTARLDFSPDQTAVTLVVPRESTGVDSLLEILQKPDYRTLLQPWLEGVADDSLRATIGELARADLSTTALVYRIDAVTASSETTRIHFSLDTSLIESRLEPLLERYSNPAGVAIQPLFADAIKPPSREAFQNLSLSLPCDRIPIPRRASRLPNTPRAYRQGIHRGIDFFAPWGTPVRAVAEGTVIQAEHTFQEVAPALRDTLLAAAWRLGRTPSDVFNHILLGQAVYIDHGFDLVPGYRVVSIYAHLAQIQPEIRPGVKVKTGQLIGQTGNTGTEDSTLGKRSGAHLHWELILQDQSGEYYLGQGLGYDELYPLLVTIFGD